MTHRLFIAIRPPKPVRTALLEIMGGVRGARWQDDGQLHLTLRYVGDVDGSQADDLAKRLADLEVEPFELQISGVGTFVRKGTPHTLWAGIGPSEPLDRLQRKVERACIAAGLPPERRNFAPHVTLARLNRSTGPLDDFLTRNTTLSLGPWKVKDYILYESHLRAEGSYYEPVVTYGDEAR